MSFESGAERRKRRKFSGGAGISALGHRDYAFVWAGALLSNVGTWVQSTALLWHVKETTGSNAWVGAVSMANFLPILLFVLFAGYVADAFDRKRVICAMFAVMMLGALTLGLAQSLGFSSLPLILALVFISGAAYTFSAPAAVSLLPDLVPEKDMLNALALSAAQFNIGRVLGPALGAVIVAVWSVAGAFYVNALSYVFVIAAIAAARPRRVAAESPRGEMLKRIGEAFRNVGRHRWMVAVLLTLGTVTFFGFSLTVLYPSVAREILGRGENAYGLLLSFTGLGAALGAPLVTRLSGRVPESRIVQFSTLGTGVFLIGFSFSRLYWLSCVLTAGIGCSYLMLGACVNTLLQARSSHEMRGRMVSLYSMMWLGMFAVGGQLAGCLGDAVSVSGAILFGGTVCLAAAAVLILAPGLTAGADSPRGGAGAPEGAGGERLRPASAAEPV